jgi:uncharacterized membrane protein YjfL (UPF0719 family)
MSGVVTLMRRVVTALVLATAAILPGGSSALASCLQQSVGEQVARADVIAYGTISHGIQLLMFPPSRQVQFDVQRVYKGDVAGRITVTIGPTDAAATSVDYAAEDGPHTLYLRRTGNAFATDACSGSHPGAPNAEENALFGTGRAASPVSPAAEWLLPAVITFVVSLGLVALVLFRRRPARVATA